jgi:hypothetical protein
MPRSRWVTVLALVLTAAGVMWFAARYAFSGPTFGAADHASSDECFRNIPREWLRGSIEHTRAETSCAHQHGHPGAPVM